MAKLPKGITKVGTGYRIRVMVDGNTYSEYSKGPHGKAHVAACIKRRDHIIRQHTYGNAQLAFHAFEVVAQDWLNTLDVKRSTSMSYANLLNNWWLPHFKGAVISKITTPDIKRVLAKSDVSNKTKRNALVVLKGVMAHAELNPNPCDTIRIRKQQSKAVNRYTPSERSMLLGALSGPARAFFAIMFGCGLRTGEALALRWGDWDGERLHLSRSMTRRRIETLKTDERRSVVVPSWVRPFINELPSRFAGGALFLNTKGGPMLDSDLMSQAWREAHKATGIPYRIPYTCRHTRAAELLSTGVAPAAAAKQLGHTVEMFLRTYSEFLEEYSTVDQFDTPLLTQNLTQKKIDG